MATVAMTKDNFETLLESHDMLIVDFWAGWCNPCRRFAPVFEAAAERHADVAFVKVDTEAERELAMQFGIRSIPTVALFREGVLLFMQPGLLQAGDIDHLLEQVRALDMDEVRRKVAEQQATG